MNNLNNSDIKIGKITLNIGVGSSGSKLNKAYKLLEKLSDQKPVRTISKKKIPTWDVREGEPIGCMVTLRGVKAINFLEKALEARRGELKDSCFDNYGNISFGLEEYLELPEIEYDSDIGIMGLGIQVTLEKKGYRIKRRKIRNKDIPKKHRIKKEEAIKFMKENFGIEVK